MDSVINMIRYFLQKFMTRQLNVEHFRRHLLHCSLLLFIIVYSFCGGLVFYKLEGDAAKSLQNEKIIKTNLCIEQILRKTKNYSDEVLEQIECCWRVNTDETAEWNYVTSTLYGFGIVTTLGYNRIAPITTAGRMLAIFYGLCGIPVTMIAIAITGRKLNTVVVNWKQKLANFKSRNIDGKKSLKSIEDQKEEEEPEEISSGFATFLIFITFAAYVIFGALLLPLLNGEVDFLNGLYYNFLCLTAIDFGHLIPRRWAILCK
uniref:Ion_trans_2 domain-containing protein n=1 Tax=Onchocerca volvulus TaxID=6282 RepID=A0A8R1TS73_ONCVO